MDETHSAGDAVAPVAGDLAAASLALARRFAAGATLWAVAPQWPAHARHVAVEFVHPVIVGKRALPAVAVTDADPVAALRALVRPGDAIVAVAGAGEPSVADVMRRAPAWGATTLWIGAGPPPASGAADHLLWLAADPLDAAHGGGFVLTYHLLWELTHVCFEHPGLLAAPPGPEVCVTCADEGLLGEVVAVGSGGRARVRTARGIVDADVSLVAAPAPGDLVVLHAGTAIAGLPDEGSHGG